MYSHHSVYAEVPGQILVPVLPSNFQIFFWGRLCHYFCSDIVYSGMDGLGSAGWFFCFHLPSHCRNAGITDSQLCTPTVNVVSGDEAHCLVTKRAHFTYWAISSDFNSILKICLIWLRTVFTESPDSHSTMHFVHVFCFVRKVNSPAQPLEFLYVFKDSSAPLRNCWAYSHGRIQLFGIFGILQR